jgi:hypothetical protein
MHFCSDRVTSLNVLHCGTYAACACRWTHSTLEYTSEIICLTGMVGVYLTQQSQIDNCSREPVSILS